MSSKGFNSKNPYGFDESTSEKRKNMKIQQSKSGLMMSKSFYN